MEILAESFAQAWAARALLASVLVGISCGVLGCFMVLRNMALIGDAISHAVLPGIFVAFVVVGNVAVGFLTGSLIAALLATVLMTWVQDNVKTKNDAAIGIIFTVMFSLGVIGISYLNTKQGVHLDLKDFLFGTIMGVSDEDIVISFGIMVYTIGSIILLYRYLFITTFQPTIAQTMGISVKTIHYFLMMLLSLTVVASLRTVGIILVVSMLITPASTALLLTNRLKHVLALSGLFGIISAIIGLLFAIYLNTTPGPLMCVVATVIYAVAVFFSPSKGIVFKRYKLWRQSVQIQKEDIIKYLSKQQNNNDLPKLKEDLQLGHRVMHNRLRALQREGYVSLHPELTLSVKGQERAYQLVRAHRLWETFLVDTVGLNNEMIHNDAEKHEHLLNFQMLDQLDARLGFPTMDPHGSPIPSKRIMAQKPLISLRPNDKGKISKQQISDHIESRLWELGLSANDAIQIVSIDQNAVTIKHQNKLLQLDAEFAQQINLH